MSCSNEDGDWAEIFGLLAIIILVLAIIVSVITGVPLPIIAG